MVRRRCIALRTVKAGLCSRIGVKISSIGDGGALRQQIIEMVAGRPAWSQRTPQASPVFSVYVATVVR